MESIPKLLASMITIVVGVLLCVSFVISSVVVNSARTFHASVITEMEASNFDEVTIQKCKEAAERSSYSLDVEQTIPENGSSKQTCYKVTLNYRLSAPIFGKVHNGEVVGYAIAGVFPTDIAVEVPENPVTGDVFIYGDYEYRYNMYYISSGMWSKDEKIEGWCARVLDPYKTSYTRPLSMIGNTPVTSLSGTYADCANLLKAPKIPNTIEYMYRTYKDCTSMSDDVVIPNGVTSLSSAFYGCSSDTFTEAPTLPEGVTDLTMAFRDCVNLELPPNIPSTIVALSSAFENCTALTTAPDLTSISADEINLNGTFYGCISLVTYKGSTAADGDFSNYKLPDVLRNAYDLFYGCTKLVSAPVIPERCNNMNSMFEGCTSLTGIVTVHGNPGSSFCIDTFKDTVKPISIAGNCSNTTKDRLVATANNGNVEIYVEPAEGVSE